MPEIGYGDALNDALDRLDDLGYERGVGVDLVNHGPMGAEALAVLGYPGEVARWVEDYRAAMPHHEPPGPRFALDPADASSWRPALGAFDRAGDWEVLFARELAEAPWRRVLARWWPRLLPGMWAGLTHGVIRTAHAVRGLAATEEPTPAQLTELARGLAYWAARWTALPGQPRLTGTHDLAAAVAAVPRPPRQEGERPGPAMAAGRLARLGSLPGYEEALGLPAAGQTPRLLGELTLHFADVYLHHPEVYPVPLVHGVTAPAAVRLVLPHLPAGLVEPSLAALWQVGTAFLMAFTTGRNGEGTTAWREEAGALPVPAPGELAARAAEHGDEHVIKFTEACLREYALVPEERYLAAAAAAQRRIPPLRQGGGGRGVTSA